MKYLVYYYNSFDSKYNFRFFGELQNAYDFTNNLLKDKICQKCYVYTLYGRRGTILYEKEK